MKKLLSIVLAQALVFPQLLGVWIVIDFNINHEYIANVLCIQKEIPDNGCRGNCHLKENLEKTSGKDNNTPVPLSNTKNEIHHFLPSGRQEPLIKTFRELPHCGTGYFLFSVLKGHIPGIFHPPKLIF